MADKKLSFEEKIKELETIINELESGNTSLDDSINKYTKAMKLVKECDLELKDVEDKIAKLVLEDNSEKEFELE